MSNNLALPDTTPHIQSLVAIMSSEFDHFLWAVPDLEDGIKQFADMTGVTPVVGGSHPGIGTRNALVSLGSGLYFEIIAPDPDQPLDRTLGQQLASLRVPTLMAFAMRAPDLAQVAAVYAAHGIDTERLDEGRQTPQGETLSWSLCEPAYELQPMDIRRPFYIDWKPTPHPSDAAPAGCWFKSIAFSGPNAAHVNDLWAQLGIPARYENADRHTVVLLLDTPNGTARFAGTF